MSQWIFRELGPDVPLHFTAFHPDFKMTELAPTPAATLERARRIALDEGLRYVYTGNVHDRDGRHHVLPRLRRGADRARLAPHRATTGSRRRAAARTAARRFAGRFEAFEARAQFGRRRIPPPGVRLVLESARFADKLGTGGNVPDPWVSATTRDAARAAPGAAR